MTMKRILCMFFLVAVAWAVHVGDDNTKPKLAEAIADADGKDNTDIHTDDAHKADTNALITAEDDSEDDGQLVKSGKGSRRRR